MVIANKRLVAIIPARGGSKRIPRKNIVNFHDKPLIAYTIESAINAKIFNKIIVSTEDPEIAQVAKLYGAEVPFLRSSSSDDESGVEMATLETLERLSAERGEDFDFVVQLLPTCPLRTSQTILSAINFIEQRKCESLISFFKYFSMNPWWAHTINNEKIATPIFKNQITQNSQQLSNLYCPCGVIWMAEVPSFLKYKTFYTPSYQAFEVDWKESIDIDEQQDLELAKILYEHYNKNSVAFSELYLRPATAEDINLTWSWVVDPEVKSATFQVNDISLSEHSQWFKSKLTSNTTKLLIACNTDNIPIGMLRVDFNEITEVSIVLDSTTRGQGYGKLALKLLINHLLANGKKTLVARVRADNLRSQRVFEKVGFLKHSEFKINNIPGLEYRFSI